MALIRQIAAYEEAIALPLYQEMSPAVQALEAPAAYDSDDAKIDYEEQNASSAPIRPSYSTEGQGDGYYAEMKESERQPSAMSSSDIPGEITGRATH